MKPEYTEIIGDSGVVELTQPFAGGLFYLVVGLFAGVVIVYMAVSESVDSAGDEE